MKGLGKIPLTDRDRRILALAAPAVAVLVALLVLRGLYTDREQAMIRLDRALEDVAWLEATKDALPGSVRRCGDGAPAQSLSSLAGSYGLVLASPPAEEGTGIRLEVASGHGNRLLAMVDHLSCRGIGVIRMELETVDQRGMVKGVVVLSGAVT